MGWSFSFYLVVFDLLDYFRVGQRWRSVYLAFSSNSVADPVHLSTVSCLVVLCLFELIDWSVISAAFRLLTLALP